MHNSLNSPKVRVNTPTMFAALSALLSASNPAVDTPAEPVRWGASELTHPNFTSAMADRPCPAQSDTIHYIDPLPYIVARAKAHKVVMINESHTKPLHRLFIAELATALRNEGFNRYGAEAFASPAYPDSRENPAMIARGYPIMSDGVYLKEPIFAQSIELVIELGYTTFAYENMTPTPHTAMNAIDHRDHQQALNILADIAQHPDAKYLIHAGYEHIRENKDDGYATTWMARYFTQDSGIDPLTINQTDCYGSGVFDGGTLGYAMAMDAKGAPITYTGFDITLIPPVEAQYKERPLWLETSLGRQFVDVPQALLFDDDFTRITAFKTDRIEGTAPEDTIYRAPHSNKPLALRPGNYRVEVRGQDKALRAQTVIEVTAR